LKPDANLNTCYWFNAYGFAKVGFCFRQLLPNPCYVVVFFLLFLCGGRILFYLIINELENILKINQKYFEKCLQVSKIGLPLFRCCNEAQHLHYNN